MMKGRMKGKKKLTPGSYDDDDDEIKWKERNDEI